MRVMERYVRFEVAEGIHWGVFEEYRIQKLDKNPALGAVGTGVYFEAAMLVAMVGFVSTVAYCRFLLRGDIIE